MEEIYDIVIVGGGISGLYCLSRILEKNPNCNVILLEKENYLGGKSSSKYDENGNVEYEMGPQRVLPTHYRMKKLLGELCIPMIPIASDVFIQTERDNFNLEFDRPNISENNKSFYDIYENGHTSVIKRFLETIPEKFIKILINVENLECIENVYTIITNNGEIFSHRVIVACTPNIYYNWSVFRNNEKMNNILSSVEPYSILKIMGKKSQEISFHESENFRIYTSNPLSMVSVDKIRKWFNIGFITGEDAEELHDVYCNYPEKYDLLIRNYFDETTENLIHTENIESIFWNKSLFTWKKDVTQQKIIYMCIEPLSNLHIVGDTFSNYQGWCEGCLQTCDMVLYRVNPCGDYSIDYSQHIKFIVDQENENLCGPCAFTNILYLSLLNSTNLIHSRIKPKPPQILYSSLFLYYNTRKITEETNIDSGVRLITMFQSFINSGIIPETIWSLESNHSIYQKPSIDCYEFAKKYPWNFDYIDIILPFQSSIFLDISMNLCNSNLFLLELKMYHHQFVDEKGYLIIDFDYAYKGYNHAVVIVGIDFIDKKIICINSQAQMNPRNLGYFYLHFQHFNELYINSLYLIKVSMDRFNTIPKEIYDTICLQEKKNKDICSQSLINKTWRIHTPYIYYDHIIVGAGITGQYLAYRLVQLYPNDKILLVDDNIENSKIHTYEYNINNKNVFLFSSIEEICINASKYTMNTIKDLSIDYKFCNFKFNFPWEKFQCDICNFLSINNILKLLDVNYKIEIFKNVYLSSISFEVFLKNYGYDTNDFQEYILKVPFPIGLYTCINSYLPSDKISIDFFELFSKFLENFKIYNSLFDFLENYSPLCFLKTFFASLETKQLYLYKQHCNYQFSDKLELLYGNIYWTNRDNSKLLSKIIPIYITRLYIILEKYFESTCIKIMNTRAFIKDNLIRLDIENFYTKPSYIINGMINELYMWEELKNFILENFNQYNPIQFVVFQYTNDGFPEISKNEKSLWENYEKMLYAEQNIHYLNSNMSMNLGQVEGNFEMVEILLSKKIEISNNKK